MSDTSQECFLCIMIYINISILEYFFGHKTILENIYYSWPLLSPFLCP